jgi:hypothetical protein
MPWSAFCLLLSRNWWPNARTTRRGPLPPFYHDSEWRIGLTAYRLAAATGDPELREHLAQALGGWPEDI